MTYLGFTDASITSEFIQKHILSHRASFSEKTFLKVEDCHLDWKDILKNTSPSSEDTPPLEERPEQGKMLDLVTHAFSDKELLLIEAPTGIGKTFAYGVPSLLFSIRTGNQVFISTNTKTLQDQIFEKDVPMLHTLFGQHGLEDFTVAKIK